MLAVAHEVVLAWGWRRRAYAFLAGAIGALALAPFDLFPLMIVPMTVSVWMIDGCVGRAATDRRVAGWIRGLLEAGEAGWWLGFGYFVAGLWWLGAAFLVEADQFAWALPLGVLGLPAILAFFPAVGFAIARMVWSNGPWRIFALATGLGLSEWLRGNLLTGFPWNVFGMALGSNAVLGQAASVIGLYGLTILAIAIFAAPATITDGDPNGETTRLRFRPLLLACAALAALAAVGAYRLSRPDAGVVGGVRLRIMQPNLQQDEKFRADNKDRVLQHYLTLSDRATSPTTSGIADVTHLFWPESAFPFILSRDPDATRRLAARLSSGAILVTGAARAETVRGGPPQYFNSLQVLTKDGLAEQGYDKVHLVPFGEYLPLGWLLEKLKLRQFVHIPGGFTAGSGPRQIMIPGLPAGLPLICYEAIFPDEAAATGARPKYLLNVTNDGWFGLTTGPYQHFSQARLRSIEQGLPMIRVANTGISAIIDPYGRVVSSLRLGVEGVLDGQLPQPIEPTLFSRVPNGAPIVVWLLAAILGCLGKVLGSRRR